MHNQKKCRGFGNTIFSIYLALALVVSHAAAQGGPPVPRAGAYLLEAELKTWMRRRDSDRVSFHVNQCGDQITMYHPAIIGGSLVLNWNGDQYNGAGQFENNGIGSVSANLAPVSETRLEGEITFIAGGFPQVWDVVAMYSDTFTEASAGDPPTQDGMGNIVIVDQKDETQGWAVTDTSTRRVSVIQFEANEAALLPGHSIVLDKALQDMTKNDSGQPNRFCESVEANWASPARGFTDGRFERRNATTLATNRAKALDEYVAPRFRGRWEGATIGGGPGNFGHVVGGDDVAPGAMSCRRAANADYKVVRRYYKIYSKDEAEKWLREMLTDKAWLEDAPIDPETGKPQEQEEGDWMDKTVDFLSPKNENAPRRALAKQTYCFMRGVKQLIEDGHCDIPGRSPAEQLLMGRRWDTTTWQAYRGTKTEALDAYTKVQSEVRVGIAQDGGSGTLSGVNNTAKAAEDARRAETVHHYSFVWPQECMDSADAIEKEYFDNATSWDSEGLGAH